MKQWWDRLLNCGLDPDNTDPFELLRYRHLISLSLTLVLIGGVFLMRSIQWDIYSRIVVVGAVVACSLVTIVCARYYRNINAYSSLITGLIYVGCINAVVTNGGVSAFTGAWLIVPPLFAQVILGGRFARFWLIASMPESLFINADELRVKQIFLNFLSNALKYTEKGSVKITIELTKVSALIIFKDTVIGMSEHDISRAFDEYNHIHSKLQKQVQSTGLGLPLSSKFIRLHGGSVSVQSELGFGSSFSIELPREPLT